MEFLFTTTLTTNKVDAEYQVYFDQEKYMFLPDANDKNLSSFSFKREHDEWHDQNKVAPQLKQQAIGALEKYLLAQH